MVNKRIAFFVKIYRALDISLVLAAFFAGIFFVGRYLPESFPQTALSDHMPIILPVIAILWGGLLKLNGAYISQRGKKLVRLLFIILKSNLQGFMILAGIVYFFNLSEINRPLLTSFIVFCTFFLLTEKTIVVLLLRYLRKRGMNYRRVLLVGTGPDALRIIKAIESNPELGFKVKGILTRADAQVGGKIYNLPVLGTIGELSGILHNRVVDEVFLCMPLDRLDEIQECLAVCEDMGINGRAVARLYEPARARIFHEEIIDIPLFTISSQPKPSMPFYLKTIGDFIVAVVLLVLLSPVFLFISFAIKLTSEGPVFFKQQRSGYNGRRFKVYKFRTMVNGAARLREGLLELNEMDGPVFKLSRDPRITPLGHFLRRTSLDELPQLINVLRGEMSLVGPRPLPVYESEKIKGTMRRRLSMKPGITGLWQVSGRSGASFAKLIQFDLQYVDHWSLWLDFKILFKTCWVVMVGKGAY